MEINPQWQNLLHIPLFGLLQILWLRGFSQGHRIERSIVWICIGLSMTYGVLDECHQLLVPGRYASLLDMALNLGGILLGTLAFFLWQRTPRGVDH